MSYNLCQRCPLGNVRILMSTANIVISNNRSLFEIKSYQWYELDKDLSNDLGWEAS